MQKPFLVDNLKDLRRKIQNLKGVWKKRWMHFLDQAACESRNPVWYGALAVDTPVHSAFAWIATCEKKWAEIARRDIEWMMDNYENSLRSELPDNDTWCYAAPMLRRAIALDWIWDSGMFSPSELDSLADFFIRDSLKYPYVVLHHRIPPHANNQGMSQALNLVVIGYIFGVKRGRDPRASHLLKYGLEHLHQQIAWLPPDGYSGEGSTYLLLVEAPLVAIACAVLEEITGMEYFARELEPQGNSMEKILSHALKLIPPSEIVPGWDQHGFGHGKGGAVLAYLAHKTKDPSDYHNVIHGKGWEMSGSFGWLRDDHVWQWLWMPDPMKKLEMKKTAHYPRPWAEDHVGGTLLDKTGNLHLFQFWDWSNTMPVRAQMNPNSLIIEAFGSILTVDGNPVGTAFPPNLDPKMFRVHWAHKDKIPSSWAQGSLIAHSDIWIDGKYDLRVDKNCGDMHGPGDYVTGRLLRHEIGKNMQIISADVADFYKHEFDLKSMIRTSAMIDNSLWVVLDQVDAASKHDYTWQLVLRNGASKTDYGARLFTAEHVVLDVFTIGDEAELLDIPGFPSCLEQKCHHLRRNKNGMKTEFITILVPQLARRKLFDWSEGWLGRRDPDQTGMPESWFKPGTFGDWKPMNLDEAFYRAETYYPGDSCDKTCIWFKKTVIPKNLPKGAKILLELPRSYPLELWMDGKPVPIPEHKPHHHWEPRLMPPFVDVSAYFSEGRASELTLRISQQGIYGISGGIRLHEALDIPAPELKLKKNGDIKIKFAGTERIVNVDRLRTPARSFALEKSKGEDLEKTTMKAISLSIGKAITCKTGKAGEDLVEKHRLCGIALASPGRVHEKKMLEFLRGDDWDLRMMAAEALGLMKSSKAVVELISIVREETASKIKGKDYWPRYRLKEMAIFALGKIGDKKAAEAITECMNADEFYGVRRLAAEALATIGNIKSAQVLEKWKEDQDPETAGAARRAISAILRRAK